MTVKISNPEYTYLSYIRYLLPGLELHAAQFGDLIAKQKCKKIRDDLKRLFGKEMPTHGQ